SQTPAAPDPEAARFTARLKTLMTQTVQLGKTDPNRAGDLKLLFSEAQVFGRKKDYAQAHARLDKAEALLKQPKSSIPLPPPLPPGKNGADFQKRLKTLAGRAVEV